MFRWQCQQLQQGLSRHRHLAAQVVLGLCLVRRCCITAASICLQLLVRLLLLLVLSVLILEVLLQQGSMSAFQALLLLV
jgi:hypothetical protein